MFKQSSMRTILALLLAFTAQASRSNRTASSNSQEEPCVLLQKDIQYTDNSIDEESDLACETLDGRILSLNVSKTWKEQHLGRDVFSGRTTLLLKGSRIHDNTLDIDMHREKQIELIDLRNKNRGFQFEPEPHRHLRVQNKNILVLRVTATFSKQDSSESLLKASIFGAGNQFPVNLKSQMEGCSFGKVKVEPASGRNINGGVLTVNVFSERTEGLQVAKALQAAENILQYKLKDKHDHVMVCLPQHQNWIAYAYLNHYVSVYNNGWCDRLSTQVHEVSHNMGLLHSGEKGFPYGDTSSVMGYSYPIYNGPKMCFNGAHSWQLGWYSYRQRTATPLLKLWDGHIYGVADYSQTPPSDVVVLKIEGKNEDYYIAFNRRRGINSGTQKGPDNILVTIRSKGSAPAQSWLIANLAPGQTWSQAFEGNRLYVAFREIDYKIGGPQFAHVLVYTDKTKPKTLSPTLLPTSTPSASPTIPESLYPTQYPSTLPTVMPESLNPTQYPVTSSPTSLPTSFPTIAPTLRPSLMLLLDLNLGAVILEIDGTLTSPEALMFTIQSYLNSTFDSLLDGFQSLELKMDEPSGRRWLESGIVEYTVTGYFVKEEVPPGTLLARALREAMQDKTILKNLVANCGAGQGLTISQIQVAEPGGVFQMVTQNPIPSPTKPPVKLESVCEAIGSNRRQCYRQGRACTWDGKLSRCVDKRRNNRRRRKKRADLFSGIINI